MPDPATPNASLQREPWPCGLRDPSCPSHPCALACGHEQERRTHRHAQEAWYPPVPGRLTTSSENLFLHLQRSASVTLRGLPEMDPGARTPRCTYRCDTGGLGLWRLPLWNWGHLPWTREQMGRGMAAFLAGTRRAGTHSPGPCPGDTRELGHRGRNYTSGSHS